jgi:hypothetical protein
VSILDQPVVDVGDELGVEVLGGGEFGGAGGAAAGEAEVVIGGVNADCEIGAVMASMAGW